MVKIIKVFGISCGLNIVCFGSCNYLWKEIDSEVLWIV